VTSDSAASLEFPVWFEPLRSPWWLLPGVRDDAPRIVFRAEPWAEQGVDAAGRDLRLGLPLYLAEAIRFSTNARSLVLRGEAELSEPESTTTVQTAVAPGGESSVRVRVLDPAGDVVEEIVRDASDEGTLGGALHLLPHAVTQALATAGVRPIWNSLYTLPAGAALASYARGLHACLRLADGPAPFTADPEAVATWRSDVRSTLAGLGSLATSTPEPFPALVFFGAVLAAYDARVQVVGESRLPVNARCTAATDPLDPVYAMTAVVLRVFGDFDASERRIGRLRTMDHPAVLPWLARVQEVV